MITCPNCKSENIDSAKFCLNCGYSLELVLNTADELNETKKCSYCSENIKKDAIVCRYCGHDLTENPKDNNVQKSKNRLPVYGCMVIVIVGIILLLAVTNPNKGAHTNKIYTSIGEAAGEQLAGSTGGLLGKLFGKAIGTISNWLDISLFEYHNYIVFSTTSFDGRIITVGYLTNVNIIAPVEDWINDIPSLAGISLGNDTNPISQLPTPISQLATPISQLCNFDTPDISPPIPSTNAVTTTSGLIYEDLCVGDGKTAKSSDTVTVNYIGWLEDGTKIDLSLDSTFSFTIGAKQVISGWDEGVQRMNVNGTRLLVIPPDLAYGSSGNGRIPPNASLTFVVQLVAIK